MFGEFAVDAALPLWPPHPVSSAANNIVVIFVAMDLFVDIFIWNQVFRVLKTRRYGRKRL